MKTCSKCRLSKEEIEFPKKKDNLDGLSGSCKKCCNAANKLNYIKSKIDRQEQIKDFLKRGT